MVATMPPSSAWVILIRPETLSGVFGEALLSRANKVECNYYSILRLLRWGLAAYCDNIDTLHALCPWRTCCRIDCCRRAGSQALIRRCLWSAKTLTLAFDAARHITPEELEAMIGCNVRPWRKRPRGSLSIWHISVDAVIRAMHLMLRSRIA